MINQTSALLNLVRIYIDRSKCIGSLTKQIQKRTREIMIDKSSLWNISGNRSVLVREDNYAYVLPCEELRGFISNFTISFPDKTMISDNYTIMPHGSVTLVLFHDNTGFNSFLFGPTTKPRRVGDAANKCDVVFIIEFQPAGFFPFTQISQKELADKVLPFSLIDRPLDKTLRTIFSAVLTADQLLLECERTLILSIQFAYPEELALAIKTIIQMEGIMTSFEISNQAFYSPRHLNRLFNLYLGMSIKAFSRLVRINKSIRLLNISKNTLDDICERLGFYDVSHFVKDFKTVCGITPQEYRTNMSDFYSEIAKF